MKSQFIFRAMVGATAIAAAAGCDDFLSVDNPTVIDASTVDPVADAPTFSRSAMNNLFTAFDNVAVYQAWFTGEAWVGDTFPTRNDIAKRTIDFSNTTMENDVWTPLARAIATGERTQELLAGSSNEGSNINIARATFASAYGIQLMAETFCQTVISSSLENIGSPLDQQQASAEAAKRFEKVIAVGTANGSDEGLLLANAARVGLARARLFQNDYAGAIAAAQQVPVDFEFVAPRVDDPANRGPLGNTIYTFTLARPSLVVPPYFRALDDPRVTSELGEGGFPTKTQGNDLDFHRQTKYTDYGDDVRLASYLEARYIIAEAEFKTGNPAPAIALITDRQQAGTGAGGDFATGDATLVELLDQRARDFYLEAQQMGTWLRNPGATPYVLRAGTDYYAEATSQIGAQTCFPVPDDEVLNNPNF
jgi:hypothetical protein